VELDGTLQTTALEVIDGKIAAIYVTRNPEKLRHVAHLVPDGLVSDRER
jgi:RNA polymerase sigma-70 factor (ECF subfamily)